MNRKGFFIFLVPMMAILMSACTRFDSALENNNNNDNAPATPDVRINPTRSFDEGNTGDNNSVAFKLGSAFPANHDMLVDYSTVDGNAIAGADYEATTGQIILPAGTTSERTINIPIISDNTVEEDEVFRIRLTITLNDIDQTVLYDGAEIQVFILNDDNNLPIAVPDTLSVLVDSDTASVNVIVNDTDDPGIDGNNQPLPADTLTIKPGSVAIVSSNPISGSTAVINADGVSIDYTPGQGFLGPTEEVTYTVVDNHGGEDATGTLTVTLIQPELSITPSYAAEPDSGTNQMVFTVFLNSPLTLPVTVDYSTADGTAAVSDNDYVVVTNASLTLNAGDTEANIPITVNGDTQLESSETFTVTLSNPSSAAQLGANTVATGTLINGLNDSGVTACADDSQIGLACPLVSHPGQDGEFGRDAALTNETQSKVGGGSAGFDFTKMDSAGQPLANQAVLYVNTPWDCVKDNTTGLWWEVKMVDPLSLRAKTHTYSWYNSSASSNGGSKGRSNSGLCVNTVDCDTEKYVAAVNAVGLCGFNDWRLPDRKELGSLLDHNISAVGPTIDVNYFPNTVDSASFWSSIPSATNANNAWLIFFFNSKELTFPKKEKLSVRLVRGRR